MPEVTGPPESEPIAVDTTAPVTPAPSAARVRQRQPKGPAKPRAPRKKPGPNSAEREALDALRAELAVARGELEATRLEVAEVIESCRDAEARVAAVRAGADALRRFVADVDTSAATVRGAADGAAAEVSRSLEQTEELEQRSGRLRAWLGETRGAFAELGAEARETLDQIRAAAAAPAPAFVAAPVVADPAPATEPPAPPAPQPPAATLPVVAALPPEERADDIRDRLVHLLNDAWGVEKEQVGLLQVLADESGDHELRAAFAEHQAACRRRQAVVQARLDALGEAPASERGLLGQLATRIWEAVRAPRDQADRAVLAVLKAASAAEFQAGLYAAAHACASSAGGVQTAEEAAELFRDQTARATWLREHLAATVGRIARK